MSLGLFAVIFIYAKFQTNSNIIRSFGYSVLSLGVGFFISGFGHALPIWATVIGTNVILTVSSAFFHWSLYKFLFNKRPSHFCWLLAIGTAPGFWYWGIIEPNGPYRSALFSFAVAAINGLNTQLLFRIAKNNFKNLAAWILFLLFAAATVWMLVRGIYMLQLDTPPSVRASNPTDWKSLLGYIILVSFMTVCIMWMESTLRDGYQQTFIRKNKENIKFIQHFGQKVLLLWSCVAVMIFGIVCLLGISYGNFYEVERNRWLNSTEIINESFIIITNQIVNSITFNKSNNKSVTTSAESKITDVFNHFYRGIAELENTSVVLIDKTNRSIKAIAPDNIKNIDLKLIKPLWNALNNTSQGLFESIDSDTGLKQLFAYTSIDNTSLVILTSLSNQGLSDTVHIRMFWFAIVSIVIVLFTVFMALLLTAEIKRRDDQMQFMAMLNHELKTPMSVIRIAADTNSFPDKLKIAISRAIDDMSSVIDRSMQSDKLEHGNIKLSLTYLSIDEIIDTGIMNSSAPARIDADVEKKLTVKTDIQLLNVILSNLIENALKYSPENERIKIIVQQFPKHGNLGVLIKVLNSPGTSGIPNAKKVFDKFYRDAHSQSKTGSGLGLFIAKGFSKKLKGELRMHATNHLITFELWIPL